MNRELVAADLVIAGYGLAGAITAIAAHDAGAEVVLLEKSPHFGGNSILSGGGITYAEDEEKAFQYFSILCGGRTGAEVISAQVKMMAGTGDFLKKLCEVDGAKLVKRGRPGIYPFPGREGINSFTIEDIPGFEGYPWLLSLAGGALLMKVIEDNINTRKIRVMTSTSARKLLRDGDGSITGLVAEKDGKEIIFKSRKAVILACGGFEHNENMKQQFLEGKPYYSMAPLTHTGDGIIMAMQAGAALWHMWHIHGGYGFKYPEFPIAFRTRHDGARDPFPYRPYYYQMRWIVVDQKGKRFMDEFPPAPQDTPHRCLSYFDPDLPGYPRTPCFLIFDETARVEGPIGRPLGLKEVAYEWSQDNSQEIERGWIIAGKSLEELAGKIGLPPDNLKGTVKRWNECVRLGEDPDFGRPKGTMFAPIESPPYFAAEAWPIIVNTQGGPEHNAQQQVLDTSGEPIPRLYAIGELGSMFGHIYELGGNLGECISSGRIAAENACEEKPLPL